MVWRDAVCNDMSRRGALLSCRYQLLDVWGVVLMPVYVMSMRRVTAPLVITTMVAMVAYVIFGSRDARQQVLQGINSPCSARWYVLVSKGGLLPTRLQYIGAATGLPRAGVNVRRTPQTPRQQCCEDGSSTNLLGACAVCSSSLPRPTTRDVGGEAKPRRRHLQIPFAHTDTVQAHML